MRWVVFDTPAMVHRAWHAMDRNSENLLTVLWSQVGHAIRRIGANRLVPLFAFDSYRSLRREELSPNYKTHKRRQYTKREQNDYKRLHLLMAYLRMWLLPTMGIQTLYQDGLEADDLIASAARMVRARPKEKLIIVSSDSDLYQCLRSNVTMLHLTKGRLIDEHAFFQMKGVAPQQWAKVKAIGGCASDGIRGVPGIGEKSAIAYVRGELQGARRRRIEASIEQIVKNKRLVALPYPTTAGVELRVLPVAYGNWFCEMVGILRDNHILRRLVMER